MWIVLFLTIKMSILVRMNTKYGISTKNKKNSKGIHIGLERVNY